MLKIKKIWEEYKVPITIVGGVCATVIGYKTYGKLKALKLLNIKIQSGQTSLLENVNLDDFPLEMGIAEIKTILTERGIPFREAVVAILDGKKTYMVR